MRKTSLYTRVILSIILGIAVGIFFGPLTSFLQPIADLFKGLVQMAFLPLLTFSIMHGLGSLSFKTAWTVLKKAGGYLILLWGSVFLFIFMLGWLIPEPIISAINHTMEISVIGEEFLSFMIPENPVYNFMNNIVPVAALFGLILGCAIMALHEKEPLLNVLNSSCYALEKILFWLARFSPIGIFAIISYEVGTIDFDQLFKMHFLLFSSIGITVFFVCFVFPILLSTLTPMSYRTLIREFYKVGLIAFASATPGIAFPFIIRSLRKFAQRNQVAGGEYPNISRTTIPVGFGFGQIGNAFLLVFLLFFAFYFRNPFTTAERIFLYLAMIPFSFGSVSVANDAIFFLLKVLGFSEQANDIYLQVTPFAHNFQVLLSVTAILTLSYLTVSSYYYLAKRSLQRALTRMCALFAITGFAAFFSKDFITMHDYYRRLFARFSINHVINNPVKSVVIKHLTHWEAYRKSHGVKKKTNSLQKVLETGVLRVGYDPRMIPFCYWNGKGELAGYDVAFAYQLARDLDCVLEFRPIVLENLAEQLNKDYYDIAMSGTIMDENRLPFMLFSDSYDEQNNVLVVPVNKAQKFTNLHKLQKDPNFRLGVIGEYYGIATRHFPESRLIRIHSMDPLLQQEVDAVMWARYDGFVWSLQHPGFAIVNFDGLIGKQYFAYPMQNYDFAWQSFVNNWLYLKEQSSFTKLQKEYWMEGKKPSFPQKRWSVIRNVLHWVD